MKKWNFIKQVIINHNELVELSHRVRSDIIKFYNKHYDNPELVVITIMDGGWNFSRSLFGGGYMPQNFKVTNFTITAKSYGNETESSGKVSVEMGSEERQKEMSDAIKGRPVLIVDDIYDTGQTLGVVFRSISEFMPKSIECCVMIRREMQRDIDLRPRFVGHYVHLPDFLVGAGLDYEGKYRDLPYVGIIKPDFKEEHRVEHICNKCGELCTSEEEKKAEIHSRVGYYGLLDTVARGHYFSPLLEDVTSYTFDLCEPCLVDIFNGFKIPAEKSDYDVWTGEVYGS